MRRPILSRSLLLTFLALPLLSAGCDELSGNPGPADDDPAVVLDGGRELGDGGAGGGGESADGGITPEPNTDGGGGGGGGGFDLPDGGFNLPDGGLVAYQGDAEDGVRCGASLDPCAAGDTCCASLDFSTFSLTGTCGETESGTAGQCNTGSFAFSCDDTINDCAGDTICCAHLVVDVQAFQFEADTTCKARTECEAAGDSEVCVLDADCPGGQVCCGASADGVSFPIDMGVCQESC